MRAAWRSGTTQGMALWTWCLNWLRSSEDLIATVVTMLGATDGASDYISNRKRRTLGEAELWDLVTRLLRVLRSPTRRTSLGHTVNN